MLRHGKSGVPIFVEWLSWQERNLYRFEGDEDQNLAEGRFGFRALTRTLVMANGLGFGLHSLARD
jgi:hypothetical protein